MREIRGDAKSLRALLGGTKFAIDYYQREYRWETKQVAELDRLSHILETFNDLFGGIAWDDRDRVGELITKTIPAKVAADSAFRNARENSDDANARIEHDKVLARIVTSMVKDDAELFKQFMDNEDFKRWMTARVFELACEQAAAS